jgi:hypothetical protein
VQNAFVVSSLGAIAGEGFVRKLIRKFVRGMGEDCEVEERVQRGAAAQRFGVLREFTVSCKSETRSTTREKSHQFSIFWCRMILYVGIGGRSRMEMPACGVRKPALPSRDDQLERRKR